MNLILTVSHNIFLNSEQRYALHIGQELEVIGASVPVWFYNNKTSEPANEIFCKYKITPTDCQLYIKHTTKGYDILLPRNSYNSNEKRENPTVVSNILDFKDGGIEWIAFRQFNDIKKHKKNITIANFVEIKTMEELTQTLC